jgi:hypothetical protein
LAPVARSPEQLAKISLGLLFSGGPLVQKKCLPRGVHAAMSMWSLLIVDAVFNVVLQLFL